MARPDTSHLKLYSADPPKVTRSPLESIGSLPEVLRAYERVTGWSLRYVAGSEPKAASPSRWSTPVNPGKGISPGLLMLDPPGPEPAAAPPTVPGSSSEMPTPGRRAVGSESAREMASAVAGMMGELLEARAALWQREAELAAGVPLVPHPEEDQHLAARLEAVLKAGAEAVDCQAAALYLLDEATSQLKLRSCWGLPFDRFTSPARPLKGAMADLEALLGHAVVLEDAARMAQWPAPEEFAAAACVPVSTPTVPLGTLWVFSSGKRDFTDRQTNILEVIAGRLAADLERAVLLSDSLQTARLKRQLAAAERLQRSQLPSIAPVLDSWDAAGWTAQTDAVGGDFYDWFCLPDGLLAVAVGHAMDSGIEAALAAAALRAMLRAHGQYHREPQQVLKQSNLTLWTGSAGDQHAQAFYGLVETASGRVNCAAAGDVGAFLVGRDGCRPLAEACPPLGESPETVYTSATGQLAPGEALVLLTAGARGQGGRDRQTPAETAVIEAVRANLQLRAGQLVATARQALAAESPEAPTADRTLLVLKRTEP